MPPQAHQGQQETIGELETTPKKHGLWCRIRRGVIQVMTRAKGITNRHPQQTLPGAGGMFPIFSPHQSKTNQLVLNGLPGNDSVAWVFREDIPLEDEVAREPKEKHRVHYSQSDQSQNTFHVFFV